MGWGGRGVLCKAVRQKEIADNAEGNGPYAPYRLNHANSIVSDSFIDLFLFYLVFVGPMGMSSHGIFGSLSARKASCNRVALPKPN